jgi:heme/copper-type cytochrome/quinol oxidase subunit 3
MDKTVGLQSPILVPKKGVTWEEVQAPAGSDKEGPSGHISAPVGLTAGRLGIWILIASEIVIFAGLLGSYILFRMAHPEWAEESRRLSLALGSLNTLILLTSNFFMMKASTAADDKRFDDSKSFMLYTMLLGLAFLVVKGGEYSLEFAHGEFPSTHLFWSFYFLMTGIHGLHILGGVFAIGLLWNRALKGTLEPVRQRVGLTGIYWSFVEVVWIFLFPLLYLLA